MFSYKSIMRVLGIIISFSQVQSSEIQPSLPQRVINEIKQSSAVFGMTLGAGLLYGVLNDQITARISLEYFTRGFHEAMMYSWTGPILGMFRSLMIAHQTSPTIIGILWGIGATFVIAFVGAILVTLVARLFKHNQVTASDIKYPLLAGMAATGLGAFTWGVKGYLDAQKYGVVRYWANHNVTNLIGWQTCGYAHNAAYTVGPIAIVGLCVWILYKRWTLRRKVIKNESPIV